METGGSSKRPLEYNGEKVDEGVADVLSVKNIPGGYDNVWKVFRNYESNPRINGNMKHLCLHIAFSPGPDDVYDDAVMQKFMGEVIEKMGYSQQPLVVYKHYDIERKHYHLVSPKVNAEGRAIRNNFGGSNWDYYGLRKIVLGLGPKYGFTVQFEKKESQTSEFYQETGLFDAKKSTSVNKDLKAIFFQALKYNYKSPAEFKDILFHYGVLWPESAYNDKKVIFQGCDRTGKKTSAFISIDGNLNWKGYTRYVDRLGNNAREQREVDTLQAAPETIERAKMDIAYLMAICRYFFLKSRSSEEYRKYLAESGVGVRILRVDGRYDSEHLPGEFLGPVKSISFMVRERCYVCSGETAQHYLSSQEIEKAEREGRWTGRAEKLIRKKLITAEDKAAVEKKIIALAEKAGIKLSGASISTKI